MSRRAPIPDQYYQRGDVYILHLDPPYKHAAHYSGFGPQKTGGAEARVADEEHAAARERSGAGRERNKVSVLLGFLDAREAKPL